ncbi:cell division protein FtsX [Paenibacillus swuensis]|uniref:Cell division protein FtsX n=1 Tax=Paenibacillus swuensis TaxID=1178515 RepID=A0A172TI56_9BACL|nr:permease-like cell division protein FtsX [Paenibacillus swuensis]ANE46739.1 cell division protein FtsX [Paenibacillus swuensis]
MKISTGFRHLREGTRNIVRNGWMSFASISSISISLFILGVFLILTLNVNSMADQIESDVEVRVYLALGLKQDKINELKTQIEGIPDVSTVAFVSKEEGIKQLIDKLGDDNKEVLKGFEGENNPLPDSFTVKVVEPTRVAEAAAQIETLGVNDPTKPITKVNYGKGAVEVLFKVTNAIRNVGLIIVGGLALTAMFLIANTIKLTILARRREIGIMKLVGATNSFIRWPFFIEGALLGVIGSIIPISILFYGYYELISYSRIELGILMIQLIPVEELMRKVGLLLLGLGTVIGIWGSTLSIRKFLKV